MHRLAVGMRYSCRATSELVIILDIAAYWNGNDRQKLPFWRFSCGWWTMLVVSAFDF